MNAEITFNDLPQLVAQLASEITTLKDVIMKLENEKAPEPDVLMTIEQASEFLHLTVPTIYNKVSRNEIPFMKRGKRLYFSREQLMDFLKAGSNKMSDEIEREVDEYLSKSGGRR